MAEFNRLPDETYQDYFVRLFENKALYKLDCNKIAELLNTENGQSYGESCYRKEWQSFNRGRLYERELIERGVKTRILCISDIHFPFAKPIETFCDYVGRVDILVLNGDLLDCYAISKFSKLYRTSPIEEMIGARQYLINLIEYIRPSKVIVTYGNHCLRLGSYLSSRLDTDIQELLPETALDYLFVDGFTHYDRKQKTKTYYEPIREVFDDIKIEYTGNWHCQIFDTIFCHPKAFASNPMKTAEKAMYFFRNEGKQFKTLVMAHTHRTGSYTIGNTTIYEQGAACETDKMNYTDGMLINSQKQGFIYLCYDKDGNCMPEKTKLVTLN